MSTERVSSPLALIGLGKMGANMARRLARGGIPVHGFDASANARATLAGEPGVVVHQSLAAAISAVFVTTVPSERPGSSVALNLSTTVSPGARGPLTAA